MGPVSSEHIGLLCHCRGQGWQTISPTRVLLSMKWCGGDTR